MTGSAAIASAVSAAAVRVRPFVVRVQPIGGASGSTLNTLGPTTGVYLPEQRCVVTSSYRVADAPGLILFFDDGSRSAATLLATDTHRKVAVLRVSEPPATTPLPPIEVAPIDSLRVGQTTIAIGRVYRADAPNLAVGILSAKRRLLGRAVQTDANISPVNYGGPLVDLSGQVIGLLTPLGPTGGSAPGDGAGWYDSGIGFAVPWRDIMDRLPRLLAGEEIRRGLAGVSLEPGNPHRSPPKIARLHPQGPASEAGLKPEDRVTSVNEEPTPTKTAFRFAMGTRDAGDEVTIEVDRKGERQRFTVRLVAELPAVDQDADGSKPKTEGEPGTDEAESPKATQPTDES